MRILRVLLLQGILLPAEGGREGCGLEGENNSLVEGHCLYRFLSTTTTAAAATDGRVGG